SPCTHATQVIRILFYRQYASRTTRFAKTVCSSWGRVAARQPRSGSFGAGLRSWNRTAPRRALQSHDICQSSSPDTCVTSHCVGGSRSLLPGMASREYVMKLLDAQLAAGVKFVAAEFAREHGVSVRTVYRHQQRVRAEGEWRPRSRRPHTSPGATP